MRTFRLFCDAIDRMDPWGFWTIIVVSLLLWAAMLYELARDPRR